jgi:hypothetical protein
VLQQAFLIPYLLIFQYSIHYSFIPQKLISKNSYNYRTFPNLGDSKSSMALDLAYIICFKKKKSKIWKTAEGEGCYKCSDYPSWDPQVETG